MSATMRINGTTVNLVRGDVTEWAADAFVYYADHNLKIGSGFGTAISQRGGPGVQKELDELGSLETTQAVITGAGNMKAAHIIHAVGPRFQEPDMEGKLRATLVNTLDLAKKQGVAKIAFPPMGAGFYGVPLPTCATVMLDTFREYLAEGGEAGFEELTICCLDNRELTAFQGRLASLK